MSESREQAAAGQEAAPEPPAGSEDRRLPYEPPKLVKKRSVAHATLGTPMGNTMSGMAP